MPVKMQLMMQMAMPMVDDPGADDNVDDVDDDVNDDLDDADDDVDDNAVSVRPFLQHQRPHSWGHPGAHRHTHIFHMSSVMIIIIIQIHLIMII